MTLAPTPGQTVGPFFHYALPFSSGAELVPSGHPDRIRLHGTIFDGAGNPVPDALVEIWQPDGDGIVSRDPGSLRRDGFTFTGFGRVQTDRVGHYSFSTVAPGPMSDGAAPFFSVCVFARGLLDRLFTRAYLPDGVRALASDTVLGSVPDDRRATLIATKDRDGYRFDIHLQGEAETVFLDHSGR
ncbi:protocatechuate 3,4-dioxygenase subunit alpha [Gordonia desulfuricans]|uniref:Protocatechuate 3,4-dioxygenase subunit alpha n=1 Tax=Gordonia desulfuricans TaxID=89051 RepID=A0A7K3LPV8_9ACTN|nr:MULTISPECIES: protocatechuate 3,4-dioxygenase subunit alpha [Gordonia]EMP14864.1 protocatechuate 3,4-dioxygenase [Gordonia sp. NB41Y]NDK90292.1 protocatechuate 3,4-dioxygenase subunit alpha [Gordonia desulfuricans]WLP90751.1 protocatechuate 3,4-dioxygenase subunit alpha [Gordonia sp. NB41Y]